MDVHMEMRILGLRGLAKYVSQTLSRGEQWVNLYSLVNKQAYAKKQNLLSPKLIWSLSCFWCPIYPLQNQMGDGGYFKTKLSPIWSSKAYPTISTASVKNFSFGWLREMLKLLHVFPFVLFFFKTVSGCMQASPNYPKTERRRCSHSHTKSSGPSWPPWYSILTCFSQTKQAK